MPGRYRVAKVRGWIQSGQSRLEVLSLPPETDLMTVELTAGRVENLHLAGNQPMFSSEFEWVAQRYPDSSWTPRIREEMFAH